MSRSAVLLVLLAGFFFPPILCAAELCFSGMPSEGDEFEFHYISSDTIHYEMNVKGLSPAPSRMETLRTTLSGKVVYTRRSTDGTEVEISILGYVREADGLRADTRRWTGKKIRVCTESGGKSVCTVIPSETSDAAGGKDFFTRGLPGTGQNTVQMDPRLAELVVALFGPSADGSPSSVLGKDGARKPGEEWSVSAEWLCRAVKNWEIDARPGQWRGKAVYHGENEFAGLKVHEVSVQLLSDHILGFDCKLEGVYRFPAKNASKGPVSILRKISFVVDRAMPEGDPLFAGNTFTVLREHESEIQLLPKDL